MIKPNPFQELAEFSLQQANEAKNIRNIFLGFTVLGLVVEGALKLTGVEISTHTLYFPLSTGIVAGMSELGKRWNINRAHKMSHEAITLSMLVENLITAKEQINLIIEAESIVHNPKNNENY